MKKLLAFIAIPIVIVLLFIFFRTDIQDLALEWRKRGLPQETSFTPTDVPSGVPSPKASAGKLTEINLAVPFSPQAPFADWSLPYQEACEETSAILVDRFYKNQPLSAEAAQQEILKLVDWEKRKFGYYMHTTAAETATILRQYFGYKRVDVLYDITADDIKSHLLAGRPVIAPLAGQLVGNPYYHQPGPGYHMLVIKGITKNGDFITNDVGTKRGQNYVYDDEVLFGAIHDAPEGGDGWPVADAGKYVETGRKAIVVVYPN